MRKLLYIFLFFSVPVYAQVNIGADGKVHTSSPGANTVTTNQEIQGGYYGAVADLTALNALPAYLKLANSTRVTVLADTSDYVWNGTAFFKIGKADVNKAYVDKLTSANSAAIATKYDSTAVTNKAIDRVATLYNKQYMADFYNAMYGFYQNHYTNLVTHAFWGDSESIILLSQFEQKLIEDYGLGGTTAPALGGGISGITNFATTGNVIYDGGTTIDQSITHGGPPGTVDFTWMPNGANRILGDAATITYSTGLQTGFNASYNILATGPGYGSATVQLINYGTGAVVQTQTVNLSAATLGAISVDFTGLSTTTGWTINIIASGTVNWLLGTFLQPSGVFVIDLSRGGTTLDQNAYSNKAILSFIVNKFNISLISFTNKAEFTPLTGSYVPTLDIFKNYFPAASKVCWGSLPVRNNDAADNSVCDSLLKVQSLAYNFVFFDGRKAMGGGYTKVNSLNWYINADGIHPTDACAKFVAQQFYSGLGTLPGSLLKRQIDQRGTTNSAYINQLYINNYSGGGPPIKVADNTGGGLPNLINFTNARYFTGASTNTPAFTGYDSQTATIADVSFNLMDLRLRNIIQPTATANGIAYFNGSSKLTTANNILYNSGNTALAYTAEPTTHGTLDLITQGYGNTIYATTTNTFTMSNKTLTSPTLTGTIAGGTSQFNAGTIYINNSGGTPVLLARNNGGGDLTHNSIENTKIYGGASAANASPGIGGYDSNTMAIADVGGNYKDLRIRDIIKTATNPATNPFQYLDGSSKISNAASVTFDGTNLNLGINGTMAGGLGINGLTAGKLTLGVPASFTNWSWRFPADPGTLGYTLTTDGSGNTSWLNWSPTGTQTVTNKTFTTNNTWQGNIIAPAYLGSGTPTASTVLYGNGIWGTAPTVVTASVITVSQSTSVNNRYYTNSTSRIILNLPTVSAINDVIYVVGIGTGGWQVAQAAGQVIHGNSDTTTGTAGYIQSQQKSNCVELRCVVANTEWTVVNSNGVLTYN